MLPCVQIVGVQIDDAPQERVEDEQEEGSLIGVAHTVLGPEAMMALLIDTFGRVGAVGHPTDLEQIAVVAFLESICIGLLDILEFPSDVLDSILPSECLNETPDCHEGEEFNGSADKG